MNKQPILDELHAVREQLLAESGGTLSGLFASLLEEQSRSTRTILKTLHIPEVNPTMVIQSEHLLPASK
jgi:hypothetical protein